MASREAQKQQTYKNILQTSEQLFREYGYENVSTRQIAKASGVAVGTVFSHFPDKPSLTKALFHEKLDVELARIEATLTTKQQGIDVFFYYADHLYALYAQDRAFAVALLQNSMFDVNFFTTQLTDFVELIASHLAFELPEHTNAQRQLIARTCFGAYFFQLMHGLSDSTSEPKQWLKQLKKECRGILRLMLNN